MNPRLNPLAVSPKLMQLMVEFGTKVQEAGLEKSLVNLVKIRASQLNACGRCLEMHTREARKSGESEERLYLLAAWRESPQYSARERAALAWTETLTLVASHRAPDDVYEQLKAEFSDNDSLLLTMLIGVINSWNRLAVGYRLGFMDSQPAIASK